MIKSLLFIRIAAISAGITMATLTLCGFGYWWLNRPKDWNEKAVIATFHDLAVDDSSHPGVLTFRYVLTNQTMEDYLLPSQPGTLGTLMKLNPKDQGLEPLTKASWPGDTVIPARQSVIIAFNVPCGDVFDQIGDPTIVSCYLNDPYAAYGGEATRPVHASGTDARATAGAHDEWDQYAVRSNPPTSIPPLPKGYFLVHQKQDVQQSKEDIINATVGGLVFFDYFHRYKIVFPDDWKHSLQGR